LKAGLVDAHFPGSGDVGAPAQALRAGASGLLSINSEPGSSLSQPVDRQSDLRRFKWAMVEYRAYRVDVDGHFVGFEPLICADDAEAIEIAKRLVNGHDVELWSGERLVTWINHKAN
jgi:hypothetical protein